MLSGKGWMLTETNQHVDSLNHPSRNRHVISTSQPLRNGNSVKWSVIPSRCLARLTFGTPIGRAETGSARTCGFIREPRLTCSVPFAGLKGARGPLQKIHLPNFLTFPTILTKNCANRTTNQGHRSTHLATSASADPRHFFFFQCSLVVEHPVINLGKFPPPSLYRLGKPAYFEPSSCMHWHDAKPSILSHVAE